MLKDHAQLKAVLADYAKVTRAEFDGWTKAQQQAFLINDYNALTIEKILQRYPDIKSIRDFGSVFGNPWKDKFFTLFGEPAALDTIEHEILRKPGVYDEPRVHFAVVCASIGCPMLRNEAFTAEKLESQLRGRHDALPLGPHAQPLRSAIEKARDLDDLRVVRRATSRRATRVSRR